MDNKKLNLEELIKIDKQLDEIKEIKVMDGKYVLNVRPNISFDDIQKTIEMVGEFLKDKEAKKIIGEEPVIKYITCFIVKNQTDLFDNLKGINSNKELLSVFNILIKTGCVNDVLNSLEKEGLVKLYNSFNEILDVAKQIEKVDNIIKKEK